MSEMIEKVASAIYEVRRFKQRDPVTFHDLFPRAKQPYLAEARAAIEAMREPTDAMIAAGIDRRRHPAHLTSQLWEDMVDAALSVNGGSPEGQDPQGLDRNDDSAAALAETPSPFHHLPIEKE